MKRSLCLVSNIIYTTTTVTMVTMEGIGTDIVADLWQNNNYAIINSNMYQCVAYYILANANELTSKTNSTKRLWQIIPIYNTQLSQTYDSYLFSDFEMCPIVSNSLLSCLLYTYTYCRIHTEAHQSNVLYFHSNEILRVNVFSCLKTYTNCQLP